MAASYVEHRPYASKEHDPVSHYAVVVNGEDVGGKFETQKAAKDYACDKGYHPVHVARVRHLQDRKNPDHWRKDPC